VDVRLIVGVLAIALGGAGVLGVLDRSRFRLYQGPHRDESPSRHQLLQRVGGGALLVVGVVFVIMGVRS
jgi:hypothetical protein